MVTGDTFLGYVGLSFDGNPRFCLARTENMLGMEASTSIVPRHDDDNMISLSSSPLSRCSPNYMLP